MLRDDLLSRFTAFFFSMFLGIVFKFRGILLNVVRVSGDFFPRTSRPSVALAVKDSRVYFVLYERCSISPLLVLVKKSPKLCVLAPNNRVYRRDFSIFLLRLANQQPAALTFASLSAKNLKSLPHWY